MWRIFAGAVLVIAGIAAFIEAHSHKPVPAETAPSGGSGEGNVYEPPGPAFHGHGPTGLSQTAYDLLRIGAWTLVIIGGLLIVVGLVGYWAAQRDRAANT